MKIFYKILLPICCFSIITSKIVKADSKKHEAASVLIKTMLKDTCVDEYILDEVSSLRNISQNNGPISRPLKIKTSGRIQLAADVPREISAQQEIRLLPGFSTANGSQMRLYINPSPCSGNTVKSNLKKPEFIIEKQTSTELIIYPNPSDGLFNLKIPLGKRSPLGYYIEVYSSDGRLIQKKIKELNDILRINIRGSAKGFYFIKARNLSTGKDFIKKIVVN